MAGSSTISLSLGCTAIDLEPSRTREKEHDLPPGDAVTVYAVIALPPSLNGADHDTWALWVVRDAEYVVPTLGRSECAWHAFVEL